MQNLEKLFLFIIIYSRNIMVEQVAMLLLDSAESSLLAVLPSWKLIKDPFRRDILLTYQAHHMVRHEVE